MSILKVANRYFEFDETDGFVETTLAGHFDSSFVSNAMNSQFGDVRDLRANLSLITPGTDSEQWFHFMVFPTDQGSNTSASVQPWLQFYNSAGTLCAELRKSDNSSELFVIRIFGTTTVTSGGTVGFTVNVLQSIDIKYLVAGTATTVEVYINGVLGAAATVPNNGARGIPNRMVVRAADIGSLQYNRISVSEFIVATTTTLGMRLDELPVNTAGFYNDMIGTVTDLNTANPLTGLVADAVGERSSWNPVAYAGTGGIVAVVASARAHRNSGAPSRLAHFLRMSGVDYDGTDRVVDGHSVFQQVWLTNPATAVAWDGANLSGIQVGLRSAA